MITITLVATGGFALAMHEFVQVLEAELLDHTLERELDNLVAGYRGDTDGLGNRTGAQRVFVLEPGDSQQNLPRDLRRMGPGDRGEIHIDAREFFVGRQDNGDTRYYLALAIAPVDALERRLAVIGWLTLVGALAAAWLLTGVFAWLILRPVRGLADRLSAYRPGRENTPIGPEYRDPHIQRIAASFDALTARFDAFLAREQRFTQDASHELRTPLAVALSACELMLEQNDLSPASRRRAKRIQAAAQRMQRLVAALLFLAREHAASDEQCDIAQIAAEVAPFYDEPVAAKGLTLNLNTQPAPVSAPAGVIDCVLHNLLDNAVEHTQRGTIDLTIDADGLVIDDSGPGISREALEHIFERRYRTRDTAGLGIGLYLVHGICQRLGWSLVAGRSPAAGARFSISWAQAKR